MTKPTENAPWWNLLFEIVALPAVNAALPFVFGAILAVALVGVGRALKRRKQLRPPK
jgi:hypothetical protein